MKTFTKKSLSVILSVLMIISSFAFLGGSVNFHSLFLTASAEDTLTEGNYKYTVTDGEAAITGYVNELAGDIILPDTLGGYAVTSIGDGAFYDCNGLKSVTIGNSVKSIGSYAFYGCKNLRSVTIPDSVTSIGDDAFWDCSGLTSVTIPNSVTSIGDSAFSECDALTKIEVSSGNKNYSSEDGVLFNIDKTELIRCPGGKKGEYIIPDSVTSIEGWAFSGCTGLRSVTIGNSVKSIGRWAFWGCTDLTSVTIGNSVKSIGRWAFYGCTGLTSVTIPYSVTSIEDYAFDCCGALTKIEVSSGNKNYSSEDGVLFNIDKTELIRCPGGKKGEYIIPDSVTSIEGWAFSDCAGLTSVSIPDSVTSIGVSAFFGCAGLTSVSIPNSVTSIGDDAFWDCSGLTSVTIPDSVTSIGDYAFSECDALTKIEVSSGNRNYSSEDGVLFNKNKTELIRCPGGKKGECIIPDSVTSIETDAFCYCSGLTSIEVSSGNKNYSSLDGVLFNIDKTELIQFPGGKTGEYIIPDSVTSIGDGAFWDCDGLKDVYYSGTEEQWNKISLGSYNDHLTDAAIHFNSTGPVITDPAVFKWSDDNSTCTAAKDGETVNAKVTSETIKEASCTEQGEVKYTATAVFSDGTTETDTKTVNIPALGHSWDNGKVTKQPTETEEGVKTFTCTRCGETKTEVIPSEKTKDETLNLDKVGGELVKSKDASEEYAVIYSQTDVNTLKNNIGGKSSYKITDVNGKEKTGGEAIATGDKINLNGRTYEIAVLGDITCDGKVNASDARLALRYSARLEKLSGIQTEAAKVSKSEKVSASEARQILRYSAKLENKFGRQG